MSALAMYSLRLRDLERIPMASPHNRPVPPGAYRDHEQVNIGPHTAFLRESHDGFHLKLYVADRQGLYTRIVTNDNPFCSLDEARTFALLAARKIGAIHP
jgi:hypothetical protein